MLYLCEKYAPLESLERYRPENDVSVTGAYVQHETHMMKDAHLNQTTMSSASQSIHTWVQKWSDSESATSGRHSGSS